MGKESVVLEMIDFSNIKEDKDTKDNKDKQTSQLNCADGVCKI